MGNPFSGGINPPDTSMIGSGISQLGALGGQLNSRRTEPMIRLRGGEVSRVTFGSGRVYDPFNVWTDVGPCLRGGLLTGAGVRESIRPVGPPVGRLDMANSTPVHFSGDFSCAFVVRVTTTSELAIYNDGAFNSSGYLITSNSNGVFVMYQSGAGVFATVSDASGVSPGGLCVLCCGRSGGNIMLKVNLRSLVAVAGIAYVPSPGTASIGAGQALDSDIYEAWFSTQTPTDALFTAIANDVKGVLGITTW